MNILYTRVSSVGQQKTNGDDRQQSSFNTIKFDQIYDEVESGSVPFFERPLGAKLKDLIEVTDGNVTLYVEDVDRLGRDLLDILQTFKYLDERGVNVFIGRYGMFSLVDGKQNDTFKLILSLMGTFAELERSKINIRTKQGREIKKAKDKELKKIDPKHRDITFKGRKVGAVESAESFYKKHKDVIELLKQNQQVTLINEYDKRRKKIAYINDLSLRNLEKYLQTIDIKKSVNTLRKIKNFKEINF